MSTTSSFPRHEVIEKTDYEEMDWRFVVRLLEEEDRLKNFAEEC